MSSRGSRDLIAGGIAGACEVLVSFPLDSVKTSMQLKPDKYKSLTQTVRIIIGNEGIRALYYGMPAMLIQVAAKAAIRFTAFEQYKIVLNKLQGHTTPSITTNLVSGLMAGATEAVVWTTPTERLKVLRQNEIGSGNTKYKGLVGSARVVIVEQGVTGLYRGVVATSIRQASSVGIRFMLYAEIKKLILRDGQKDTTPVQAMAAGGIVGAISVIANNPIDVVKSRIQAQSKGNVNPKYQGTFRTFMTILNEEGFGSFYRGVAPRVLRVGIGQAITFASYEAVLRLLDTVLGPMEKKK